MSKGRTLRNLWNKIGNKIKKHNYKHIIQYTSYEFMDLLDWKLDDRCGNSHGSRSRRLYRKQLRRIAKKRDKLLCLKEIEDILRDYSSNDRAMD